MVLFLAHSRLFGKMSVFSISTHSHTENAERGLFLKLLFMLRGPKLGNLHKVFVFILYKLLKHHTTSQICVCECAKLFFSLRQSS